MVQYVFGALVKCSTREPVYDTSFVLRMIVLWESSKT